MTRHSTVPGAQAGCAEVKPPRVLHFLESLGIGGAERTVQDLATRLPGFGIGAAVCCLRDGPLREPLERAGVTVYCLNLDRRSIVLLPWFVSDVLRALWRLASLVRRQQFDILHAHIADAAMLALAAGRWCRVPVIVSFHGLGLLPRQRRRYDPRTWLRRRLYRAIARGAHCSIAVSPDVRQALCDEFGFAPARTVVLRNGIDTMSYASTEAADAAITLRAELGLAREARVILAVGRLVHNKGQTHLLDAMPTILRGVPSAILVLMGDGPDRGVIEQRVAREGLGHAVRLTGARSDVAAHLALAEIFTLVSASEGVPLALLEAMAAARPIVATAVPGIVDIIEPERTGILVPFADPGALAQALLGLMEDQALARQYGANAQQEVRARYDIEGTLRQLVALYGAALPPDRRTDHNCAPA